MSLLQKQSNPSATAVNNAINHDRRQPLHDDSGALTGLRQQPDYGESDSLSVQMNQENSKGASAGYIIAVETASKTAAPGDMYINSVEYNTNKMAKVERFTFTADQTKALVFHRLTAAEITHQINGPAFGARARVILAASDYEEMFKAVERVAPKSTTLIKRELAWAKQQLKKKDRIIWFLRGLRLAIVQNQIETLPATVGTPTQASLKKADDPSAVPQPSLPGQQQIQPRPPKVPLAPKQQLEKLLAQYKKESLAKGGSDQVWTMDNLWNVKQQLEHFYSLPIPEIQNRVLGFETYETLVRDFTRVENVWKEEVKKALVPHKDDQIWKQFSDGWAWWWLPRPSCSDESAAMGHCGNSPMRGRSGVSILSLREPKKVGKETRWYPHATFILHGQGDSGSIGEMKGRANKKPVARYHPYIMELFKDKRIHGLMPRGYLPEEDFSLDDLTSEQRKQVRAANPNIGTTIKDYYEEYGMDDNLQGRIQAILELPKARYDEGTGFIVREWENTAEFLQDCGSREARAAYKFTETGETDHTTPDEDEMSDLLDQADSKIVYHVGMALQYHYAREMKDWYRDHRGDSIFDPRDLEMVKQAIKDIYEMDVAPKVKAQKDEEKEQRQTEGEDVPAPAKKTTTNPYKIPVIEDFWRAYVYGGPDQDTIGEILDEKMRDAMNDQDSGIKYGGAGAGIMQVVEPEVAVEKASVREGQGNRYRDESFEKPSIDMPYNWDEWDEERAVSALNDVFSTPPKRPELEKQKRLFKEPKDEAEAKRKGITISKLLKNSLFAKA